MIMKHSPEPCFLPDSLTKHLRLRIEAWQMNPLAIVSILAEPLLDRGEGIITLRNSGKVRQQLDMKLKIKSLQKAQPV
jgi:hypothetical protein